MLFGAVIGFIVALNTGNLWLGVLLAMLAGMLLSALLPWWHWCSTPIRSRPGWR